MSGPFKVGEWLVEPQLNTLTNGERATHVEPKAMQVLVCLAERKGEVVPKARLMRVVWADTFVTDDVLMRAISDLRKAFGDDSKNPHYIQTVPKSGYRLIASVVDESVKQETDLQAAATLAEAIPESKPKRRWGLQLLAALVMLLAVVFAAVYLWVGKKPKPVQLGAVRSIAVLPFKPLVADSRDETFELGMADTLINKLSRLSEIIVRPIGAVRKYGALDQDPVAAGQEQKVDAVLDSSIQRSDQRIRVSVRLLSVSDGSTLCTCQCDEQCADVFAAQDLISEKITQALALRLADKEKERLVKHHTENKEAYQLYIKGRFFFNKVTQEGYKKSIEYFQQAINLDPNYALAYAGVAESYLSLGILAGQSTRETMPKAREAAAKALAIDDTLAEAHTSVAITKAWYDWDFLGTEKEFRRAIELKPHDSASHLWYAQYLMAMGRQDESIAEIKLAQELDPASLFMNTMVGWLLMMARRYDEAIEQGRKTVELDPNFSAVYNLLEEAYMLKGMYDESVEAELKGATLIGRNPADVTALKKAYARGIKGFWREFLNQYKELARREYIPPEGFSQVYAFLGEKEQALTLLERAYEERRGFMMFIKVDPRLDSLRSDPRFTDLLRRVGLLQ